MLMRLSGHLGISTQNMSISQSLTRLIDKQFYLLADYHNVITYFQTTRSRFYLS